MTKTQLLMWAIDLITAVRDRSEEDSFDCNQLNHAIERIEEAMVLRSKDE